jgi:hypothetical protein
VSGRLVFTRYHTAPHVAAGWAGCRSALRRVVEEEAIDGEVLLSLTEDDMTHVLKLSKFGHRRKLSKLVERLNSSCRSCSCSSSSTPAKLSASPAATAATAQQQPRQPSSASAARDRCTSEDLGGGGGLGEMVGHHQESVRSIAPLDGRLLLFWSDRRTPHEVLSMAERARVNGGRGRLAMTCWYYDRSERAAATAQAQAQVQAQGQAATTVSQEGERQRQPVRPACYPSRAGGGGGGGGVEAVAARRGAQTTKQQRRQQPASDEQPTISRAELAVQVRLYYTPTVLPVLPTPPRHPGPRHYM